MPFITITTDLSAPGSDAARLEARTTSFNASASVRRPLRGIQLKKDTYATIAIVGSSDSTVLNSSASQEEHEANNIKYTSNFLLQSVSESRQEKFQTVTTFGTTYGFFFGESPRMVAFQSTLLNTLDFQWEIEWWANYEETLRGTRLVDRQLRVYLTYDDVVMEGYLVSAQTSKNAANPHEVSLSFSMWVTSTEYLVTPGDPTPPQPAISEIISLDDPSEFTEEIKEVNIVAAASQDSTTGLLATLRANLDKANSFTQKVGQDIRDTAAFLYGRNLVVPVGYAGSEANAGGPTFAVDAQGRLLRVAVNPGKGTLVSVITPTPYPTVPANRTFYYHDNTDEYPRRETPFTVERSAELNPLLNEVSSDTFDPLSNADAAFKAFGIDTVQADVDTKGNLARVIKETAFGFFNYGAAASGVSNVLGSLTVGNVVGQITGNRS